MTGNFCAVFAGVGVGGAEDGYQYFVDVANVPVVNSVRLGIRDVFGKHL